MRGSGANGGDGRGSRGQCIDVAVMGGGGGGRRGRMAEAAAAAGEGMGERRRRRRRRGRYLKMSLCVELFFCSHGRRGISLLVRSRQVQLSHHNHHAGGSTEFLRRLGHGKGRVQMAYPNPEGMLY